MSAVRSALDLQQDRAVHHAVQEGHGQGWIAEAVGPGLEVDVGHQAGAPLRTAPIDDFVQQVGCLRRERPLQAVEAELVDNQPLEPRLIVQPCRQGLVGQAGGEILQQLGAGRIADVVAQHAALAA